MKSLASSRRRANVYILKPLNESNGNHTMFYEVNNRGNKLILERLAWQPPAGWRPRHCAFAGRNESRR